MQLKIPFNKPYMTGRELALIADAHASRHLSGDGKYTKLCNKWLEELSGAKAALPRHS